MSSNDLDKTIIKMYNSTVKFFVSVLTSHSKGKS